MDEAGADKLYRQARTVIDQGSKSFALASRLFSKAMRRDVVLLYAWCRYCDDLTDGQELGRGSISTTTPEALATLREHSLAALNDAPTAGLPFQALAAVARRHPISEAMVSDHIRGFELDVAGWRPETFDDTLQYCYHTAGTVGIMMATIMGVRDAPTLHRASDLGIAFQLTNIARDVVEDATAGRVYLPQTWLSSAGLNVADLAEPASRERVFPLVKHLIDETEPYYRSAAIGIRALPRRAAWAIATARTVYRDIGQKILQSGPIALNQRTYTSGASKAAHAVKTIRETLAPRRLDVIADRRGLWTPSNIA